MVFGIFHQGCQCSKNFVLFSVTSLRIKDAQSVIFINLLSNFPGYHIVQMFIIKIGRYQLLKYPSSEIHMISRPFSYCRNTQYSTYFIYNLSIIPFFSTLLYPLAPPWCFQLICVSKIMISRCFYIKEQDIKYFMLSLSSDLSKN